MIFFPKSVKHKAANLSPQPIKLVKSIIVTGQEESDYGLSKEVRKFMDGYDLNTQLFYQLGCAANTVNKPPKYLARYDMIISLKQTTLLDYLMVESY